MINHVKTKLRNAELVLVGLGEDFDFLKRIREDEKYIKLTEKITDKWLVPYIERLMILDRKEEMMHSYRSIEEKIKDKNYFVVTTCLDDLISFTKLRKDRIVKPCGGFSKLQCESKCCIELFDVPEEIDQACSLYIKNEIDCINTKQPRCPYCGKPLVFNNIQTPNYIEESYLSNWKIYMQWLQGTVNKDLCIIELGVGLKYPSVIRWPFEKITFFNEKAEMFRVHERLYQVTEEIKEKGYGICQDPIEFLKELSTEY